jgi:hypothetical protein
MELRFHSPYRAWIRGLLTEIAVFVLFMTFAGLLALAAAWIA